MGWTKTTGGRQVTTGNGLYGIVYREDGGWHFVVKSFRDGRVVYSGKRAIQKNAKKAVEKQCSPKR